MVEKLHDELVKLAYHNPDIRPEILTLLRDPTMNQKGAAIAKGLLGQLLAVLRTLAMVHQTAHWQTKGSSAYGDHLLFERLYENIGDEVDVLAEKLVAYYDAETVSLSSQLKGITQFEDRLEDGCVVKKSLRGERLFQRLLKGGYRVLSGVGTLTLGLDDFLMTLANNHETHIYLLQQRLR